MFIWKRKKCKKRLSSLRSVFDQKKGFEIGGPSKLFLSDVFPVYDWVHSVDNCNFRDTTLWEKDFKGAEYRHSARKYGVRYIAEGTALPVEDEKYDFVLSSHCIEHIANPLNALEEWKRILKPGGFVVLVFPDKNFTFDHRRAYTSFEHLLTDYNLGTSEHDLSHLSEILKLHDLRLDPDAGLDFNSFKERSEKNTVNRALHHHVFSQEVMRQCFSCFDLDVVCQEFVPPFHQIIIGKKRDPS
nr:class I SAM-dependent methyltransferase [Pedobacter sp. SYSU D00535]